MYKELRSVLVTCCFFFPPEISFPYMWKSQKIIGNEMPFFLRHGISIITIVLILICMACYFIPYENGQNIIEYMMNL